MCWDNSPPGIVNAQGSYAMIRATSGRGVCGVVDEGVHSLQEGIAIRLTMDVAAGEQGVPLATESGKGSSRDGRGAGPRCGEGGEAKVVRWIRRWRKEMLAVALRGLDDDGDAAEDIVQKAALKVLVIARRKPTMVEEVRDPCAWLVRVTKNMVHDYRRTGSRRERILFENENTSAKISFGPSTKEGRWIPGGMRSCKSRRGYSLYGSLPSSAGCLTEWRIPRSRWTWG